MLTSAMVNTSDGKGNVQNKHDLSSVSLRCPSSINGRARITQAAAAKPSSHPNAFCMYKRQYMRIETKIVVKTRKSV
jgi:hypothetical protein